MAGAVVLVGRRWPLGAPATAVGVLVLVALTTLLLAALVTSESSTAPLLLLFLPLHLGAVVLAATGAAVLVHRVRARRGGQARRRATS